MNLKWILDEFWLCSLQFSAAAVDAGGISVSSDFRGNFFSILSTFQHFIILIAGVKIFQSLRVKLFWLFKRYCKVEEEAKMCKATNVTRAKKSLQVGKKFPLSCFRNKSLLKNWIIQCKIGFLTYLHENKIKSWGENVSLF